MAGTGDPDMGRFQELLDDQYAWPAEYTFKFIVPEAELERLKAIFGQVPLSVRASRKGRYMSVTARMLIHSSDEVVAVYRMAGTIPGVIAL